MLTISHKTSSQGKTYAAIAAVTKLLKGVEVGGEHHKRVHYEIEHGKNSVFQALPEWIQKKIMASDEMSNPAIDSEESHQQVENHQESDDTPF
jgi:hypothetical protein